MALMTVFGTNGPPARSVAAGQLGVAPADIDPDYGMVLIDPDKKMYAVKVRADRLPHGVEQEKPYRGPFSDPKIEPFGGPNSF